MISARKNNIIEKQGRKRGEERERMTISYLLGKATLIKYLNQSLNKKPCKSLGRWGMVGGSDVG